MAGKIPALPIYVRHGTTQEHENFIGHKSYEEGSEITVNEDENRLIIHDGVTNGGFPTAKLEEIREAERKIANIKTELLIEIAKGTKAWNATTEYKVGDYVIHEDTIYRAKTKHTGITPSTTITEGLVNWSDILSGYVKLNKDGQYLKSIINFENFPVIDVSKISTGYVPTGTNQLTNKKYVDDTVSTAISNALNGSGKVTSASFADVTVGDVDIFPTIFNLGDGFTTGNNTAGVVSNDIYHHRSVANQDCKYTILRKGVVRISFNVIGSYKNGGLVGYATVYKNDVSIWTNSATFSNGDFSIDVTVNVGDVIRFVCTNVLSPFVSYGACYLKRFMLCVSAKSFGECPVAWVNAPIYLLSITATTTNNGGG